MGVLKYFSGLEVGACILHRLSFKSFAFEIVVSMKFVSVLDTSAAKLKIV